MMRKLIFVLLRTKKINQLIMFTKILSIFEKELNCQEKNLKRHLESGNLYSFEEHLSKITNWIYDCISREMMTEASSSLSQRIAQAYKEKGVRKLENRPMSVQLKTGTRIKIEGYYAKKASPSYEGDRHILRDFWKVMKGASPYYMSQIGLLGVLSPSFEVACKILNIQGVSNSLTRVKELVVHLGKECVDRQTELSFKSAESLSGKRVVIGIDGGRTRTRQYTGQKNKAGNERFETPWKEPKMFVIEVIDDAGEVDRHELPIYGCLFGDDEVINLLSSHLEALGIQSAKHVQIVADGAPWIWNRARQMLLDLGVKNENITETVDYYHAVSYVHQILAAVPKKYEAHAATLLPLCKKWLWAGKTGEILKHCRVLFTRPSQEVSRYLNYLEKNTDRMQYVDFQSNKLMCGSGIIESGIRRVINLRFKNSSAFWNQGNVEGLYYLRGIMLSFRWEILVNNLFKG